MTDTSRNPTDLHPSLRTAWEWAQAEWRVRYPWAAQPFLTTTYRGPVDQQVAFDAGLSRARFGESLHNFKPALAFDVAFLAADGGLDWSWDTFVDFAALLTPLGLVWGGSWPQRDGPHFESAISLADARAGKEPPALRIPPSWLAVVMLDGQVLGTVPIPAVGERVAVVNVGREQHRVWVDIRYPRGE